MSFLRRKGFTLVELLLAIAIIGVLAAVIVTAINPAKQLGDARNAQRRSDLEALLNAVWQYALDHGGTFPCATGTGPCIDTTIRMLGIATTGCSAAGLCEDAVIGADDCIDLASAVAPTYIYAIPQDPKGSADRTRYVIQSMPGNRVRITACDLEGEEKILSVSR
jgi:type IV pilus assembly protein PilA